MSVLSDWTSSLTPAFTRSSRPTRLPFLPFPFSSGIGSSNHLAQSCKVRGRRAPAPHEFVLPSLLCPQERSVVVELAWLAFGPLIQLCNIHQDLTVGCDFDLSSIHGARRWSLEINSFAVVSAAVARTLEFVLAWLPVGRAA